MHEQDVREPRPDAAQVEGYERATGGRNGGAINLDVGQVLQAFGAHNGMLCDEGGSSCMYTRLWGIVNSPSDGEERETYTHFGVITPK